MTGTAPQPHDPQRSDPEGTVYVPAVPSDATAVMPAMSTETTGMIPPVRDDTAPDGRHGVPTRAPGTVYRAGTFPRTDERAGTHGPDDRAPGTYGRPPTTYGQPPTTYGQPPTTYGQPPAGYDQAPATYGRPGEHPDHAASADQPAGPGRPATQGTVYGSRRPAGPPEQPAPPSPAGTAGDDGASSVTRNSAMMAGLSLVSRATGALRTLAIAAALGDLLVADDYNVANMLPNMLYEFLLGGVLASVVVPLLVRARSRDDDGGEAYTHRLVTLVAVTLGAATIIAVLAAPVITALMSNSRTPAADRSLTTVLAYLLLPEIFFYGMAAVLSAVLNTRNHFAAPMWTPILNNVVVIATAGVFILVHGTDQPQAASMTTAEILILGVGTTLGIVIQALGLLPALRRVGYRWRWRWDFRELHLRELGRIGGWALCYVAASQVGVVVVLWMARYAGNRGGQGAAVYLYAYLILMMAHGIVAVSIITALMPRLSAAATDRRYGDVTDGLALGTRLSAALLIPAAAGYIVLGRPMAVVLFDWGAYNHSAALATGTVIAWSALGLVPFAVSQLQMFTFYALPDTKTPALINIPTVVARLLIDGLFLVVLPAAAVVSGLMVGNAVSYTVACAIGYVLLRRRLGPLGLRRVGAALGRMSVAAVTAAVAAALLVFALVEALGTGHGASLLQLVLGGAVLLGVYLAVAVALRVREITQVWEMVRSRLGR